VRWSAVQAVPWLRRLEHRSAGIIDPVRHQRMRPQRTGMVIDAGYDIAFDCLTQTSMLFQLNLRPSPSMKSAADVASRHLPADAGGMRASRGTDSSAIHLICDLVRFS
jgi:hypothetical protein